MGGRARVCPGQVRGGPGMRPTAPRLVSPRGAFAHEEAAMSLRTPIFLLLAAVAALAAPPALRAAPRPTHLPRYTLDIDLDTDRQVARVRMEATWVNPTATPTDRLVFNAHSRYVVPDDQIGFTAKMLEILRMTPSDTLGVKEPPLVIDRITHSGQALPFSFEGETKTDLVVPLPGPVKGGESVTVVLEMTMHLPPKQGRWGQWEGVTTLSNWLPVFAIYALPVPPRPAAEVARRTGEGPSSYVPTLARAGEGGGWDERVRGKGTVARGSNPTPPPPRPSGV